MAFFPSLKHYFIAYRSSKVSSHPDCIFEIHQLWQSGFSRVYSNCCCSCSFEREIIKIGQSSPKMYSNNILKFQESTTISYACTKKGWKLIECTTYNLYFYSLMVTIVCNRNKVRECSHISFFCGGDPFCEVVRRPENTHEELTGLLEWPAGPSLRLRDHRTSPFCLSDHWGVLVV